MVVTIHNNSEYELIAGLHFMVDFFDGADWLQVPWYGAFEGVFADIGYSTFPNFSENFTKNLELVETLTPGLYRIRKVVFRYVDKPISENDLHDVVAEFHMPPNLDALNYAEFLRLLEASGFVFESVIGVPTRGRMTVYIGDERLVVQCAAIPFDDSIPLEVQIT
jgi:hypothetical protein